MINAAQNTERKSDLVKAIEARKRPSVIMQVNMAVGILAEPIHKIAFRVNVKREDNDAVDRAHKYLQEYVPNENARSDGDVLNDSKLIAALWHSCREVKTTKDAIGADIDEETIYPVFPSPQWMHDHLTTDQIAVLVNMHNAARAQLSPFRPFDLDLADQILRATGDAPDERLPTELFSRFSRDGLQSLVMYASRCLAGARAALAEVDHAPEGHKLVDVEHAALLLQSRAEKTGDDALKARAQAMLDVVAVLRAERPASTLEPDPVDAAA